MKKKILSGIAISLTALPVLAGCSSTVNSSCEHNYVETKVEATCTSEGYSFYTCNKCNNTYYSETKTPLKNHSGIGKCTVCNADLNSIWQEFITNNAESGVIAFEGKIATILSYTDDYDCMLYAITSNDDGKNERTLTLGYNAYDKKWTWLFDFLNGFGTAGGSFTQWSSHSSSLNCELKTGYITAIYTDAELLAEIKRLYNVIINNTNSKLEELGFNITMANFGLEN